MSSSSVDAGVVTINDALAVEPAQTGVKAQRRLSRGALFVIASVAVHALLLLVLNKNSSTPGPRARTMMTLEVPPPAPPSMPRVDPVRPPTPARARPRAPSPRTMARPSTVPAAASPRAAPASADEPVDMTGVTLTGGEGAAWASAAGDGSRMNGPVVMAHARRSGLPRSRDEAPVTALANLSRVPEPPPLTTALERLYPAEARRAGTPGEAVVAARVLADGTLDRLRAIRSTQPSFAQACLQLLTGSRWSSPLDRAGKPCATEIRYTCRFQTHD